MTKVIINFDATNFNICNLELLY